MNNNDNGLKNAVKFSILVPVYNVECYLVECIKSVLIQTYRNFELILVNDGSTDSSGEICDEFAKNYSEIKVYHKNNRGSLHARKYAIERAVGEYCIFLDSDDYLEENALERIYNTMVRTGCDCVVFGMNRVRDGKILSVMKDSEECTIEDKRELYRKCFMSVEYNSLCRKTCKTSILKGVDFSEYYHIKYGEDLLQSLDILKNSSSVTFIKDALYNYRLNFGSITQTITYEKFKIENTVREKVLSFLKEEGVFTDSDFEDYRSFCIQLIIKKLYVIGGFDISMDKKIGLYNELKSSDYYMNFVGVGAYNRKKVGKKFLMFDMYQKGYYRLLTFFIRARQSVKLRKDWKG